MSEEHIIPVHRTKTNKRKKMLKRGAVSLLAVVVLAALGSSAFFYNKYRGAQNKEKAQQASLLQDIGKSVQLPGEEPVLVTVADKDKLTNKTLAATVENKDILLIYGSSKRMVVYRPSSGKVIDMLRFADKKEVDSSAASGTNKTPSR